MTVPSVPTPPSMPSIGLDDLDDDLAAPLATIEEREADIMIGAPGQPTGAIEASSEVPDSLQDRPDTDANEIEPGVPAEPVPARKPTRTPRSFTPIDWNQAVPRKADDFAPSVPTNKAPVVIERIRDFLNQARQNGWYGLYYPVLAYESRNTAQSNVTKVNQWRKHQTNRFGVRDGEEINAKCETQAKEKHVVWVALLQSPESKAADRDFAQTPQQMAATQEAESQNHPTSPEA